MFVQAHTRLPQCISYGSPALGEESDRFGNLMILVRCKTTYFNCPNDPVSPVLYQVSPGKHQPKKSVVAVIYSHSHGDHYGGGEGVLSEEGPLSRLKQADAWQHLSAFSISRQLKIWGVQINVCLISLTAGFGDYEDKGPP